MLFKCSKQAALCGNQPVCGECDIVLSQQGEQCLLALATEKIIQPLVYTWFHVALFLADGNKLGNLFRWKV